MEVVPDHGKDDNRFHMKADTIDSEFGMMVPNTFIAF
jgi:hypothetical protein